MGWAQPAFPNANPRPSRRPRSDKIRRLLDQGYKPRQIAKVMARRGMGKHPAILRQAYQLAGQNKNFQEHQAARAKGIILSDMEGIMSGLLRRARTGRPDAVKLALEMTGVHNPKMQHEHSGDISIRLELPRPTPPKAIDVPDADVVDS
jgi:hypothetical protein